VPRSRSPASGTRVWCLPRGWPNSAMTSGSIVRWCSRRNSRTATAAQGPSGAHPLATKAKPASGETAKNALHRRPLPGPCRPGLRPLHARSSPLPSGLPREPNTGAAGGQRPPLECRYRDASQRGTTSDSRSGRRPPPLTGTRAVLVPVTAHIRAHPRTSAHIRCAERRPSVPGGPLLHTREVAGSKPAAPISKTSGVVASRPTRNPSSTIWLVYWLEGERALPSG